LKIESGELKVMLNLYLDFGHRILSMKGMKSTGYGGCQLSSVNLPPANLGHRPTVHEPQRTVNEKINLKI